MPTAFLWACQSMRARRGLAGGVLGHGRRSRAVGSISRASRPPSCAPTTASRREQERLLVGTAQLLDPVLLAQTLAPGGQLARPRECHGEAGTSVAGGAALRMLAKPGREVLRDAGVE